MYELDGIPTRIHIREYFYTGHDDTDIEVKLFDRDGVEVFKQCFISAKGIDTSDNYFFAFQFADYIQEKYGAVVETLELFSTTYSPKNANLQTTRASSYDNPAAVTKNIAPSPTAKENGPNSEKRSLPDNIVCVDGRFYLKTAANQGERGKKQTGTSYSQPGLREEQTQQKGGRIMSDTQPHVQQAGNPGEIGVDTTIETKVSFKLPDNVECVDGRFKLKSSINKPIPTPVKPEGSSAIVGNGAAGRQSRQDEKPAPESKKFENGSIDPIVSRVLAEKRELLHTSDYRYSVGGEYYIILCSRKYYLVQYDSVHVPGVAKELTIEQARAEERKAKKLDDIGYYAVDRLKDMNSTGDAIPPQNATPAQDDFRNGIIRFPGFTIKPGLTEEAKMPSTIDNWFQTDQNRRDAEWRIYKQENEAYYSFGLYVLEERIYCDKADEHRGCFKTVEHAKIFAYFYSHRESRKRVNQIIFSYDFLNPKAMENGQFYILKKNTCFQVGLALYDGFYRVDDSQTLQEAIECWKSYTALLASFGALYAEVFSDDQQGQDAFTLSMAGYFLESWSEAK